MKSRLTVRARKEDKALAFKESVKILGVTFDRRLSFFLHADALRARVETLLTCVNTLARLQGGRLRPEQKKTLYRNVILPAVTYASPIWWDEVSPDWRLKSRMISIQRSILLHLSEAFHTTRTAALQVLMHAPPIELELDRMNAEFRLFTLPSSVRYGDLIVRPEEVMYPVDRLAIHPAGRASFPHRRLTAGEANVLAGRRALHIYTDGSYAEGMAGAAYVVFGRASRVEEVGRFAVSGATSAFCAEAVALGEALKWLKDHPTAQDVYIYTDCLSLLYALGSRTNTDPRIAEMQSTIKRIEVQSSIKLCHVPGHSGVFGNEVADFIASRAARRGIIRQSKWSSRTVRAKLNRELRKRWASEWSSENRDTELYKWVPDLFQLPAYFPPNKALVQLLTGHGRFHTYFHRFNLLREPRCFCGSMCEGIEHYLVECPVTKDFADQINPRVTTDSSIYPRVIKQARNRALLIRLVKHISDLIPDISR
ncbi:hypothetical protein MRX96_041684 [Rhipicephalus microplus]